MQVPPPQPQQPIQQPYNAYGATPQPGMQHAPMTVSQVPMSTMNTVHQQAVYQIDANGCKKSGGMQMGVGMLILIFGIVSVCIDCEYSYYGTAIWGGIWYIVGGFVGASAVRASGSSANCQLTGYLVLNIFSIIYAIDLVVTMCFAIPQEGGMYSRNNAGVIVLSSKSARIAIDSILLALAILEVFAACWGSGVASKTVCGGARHQTVVTTQPVQIAYTTTTTAPGYYANQPAAMPVTTQYAYVNQNGPPGPSLTQQPGAAAYPPPTYEKKPLEQP